MPAEVRKDLHLEVAHVLFMDVVGFSKLLINDQTEILAELNKIVRDTPHFREAEAVGKLVRLSTGDGQERARSEPTRNFDWRCPKLAHWIDYLYKREATKIAVTRVDVSDPVFTHQGCGMEIVHNVAAQVRHFGNDLAQHLLMLQGRQKQTTCGGIEQALEKLPRRMQLPRSGHDVRMRADAEKLVADGPR